MRFHLSVFALFAAASVACPLSSVSQTRVTPAPDVILGTGTITTYAGNGEYRYSGDGSKATVASIYYPQGMTYHEGNLYIADYENNVVRKVDSNGIISTFAGDNALGSGIYSGDGGPATLAGLYHPGDLVFDNIGNLYIADKGNNVIRKVDAATMKITTYAGTGTGGYNGDGALATKAELYSPDGLTIDQDNNLYIADYANNAIREVVAKTGIINTIAGTGVAGYSGNGGQAVDAELNGPAGMFYNSAKKTLYFADSGNGAIRDINASGVITTFAGTGNLGGYYGAAACSSGNGTAANLTNVYDVKFDVSGNAYFPNYYHYNPVFSQVCKVDTSGNISVVAGPANSGYGGDGGPADQALLNEPSYLAFDPVGNLYIADTSNNRIRKVTYSPVPPTAAPKFSPKSGPYPGPISVTITDATKGAVIYYTTDGTTPTTASSQYIGPIPVTENTTINAFAQAPGDSPSAIVSATYTIATARPTFRPPSGSYTGSVSVIIAATKGATIHYTLDGTVATTASLNYTGPIAIGKTTVINAIATATGLDPSADASATYTIEALATTPPVPSPAGGTFGVEQFVTITDATAGAIVYYTLNGTAPTVSSTKYTVPVAITHSETLKTFAVAPAYSPSAVVSVNFIVAGAPEALIAPATLVSASSATMNALITSSGPAATCVFEYGTSATALNAKTRSLALAPTAAIVPINASVTGLKSKTTYYYQVVATSVGGSSTSAIASFTTN